MMEYVLWLLVFIAAFFGMEGVAWLLHRYVMHGFLWALHKDHHQGAHRRFERNDLFLLIFAAPAVVGLYFGLSTGNPYLLALGAGVSAYGTVYFVLHDIVIHQRLKYFKKLKHPYLQAARRAHKMHHKHINKNPGESYGMLFFNKKYVVNKARK